MYKLYIEYQASFLNEITSCKLGFYILPKISLERIMNNKVNHIIMCIITQRNRRYFNFLPHKDDFYDCLFILVIVILCNIFLLILLGFE